MVAQAQTHDRTIPILILDHSAAAGGPARATLLFGQGLVGAAVADALPGSRTARAYDWGDASARSATRADLAQAVAGAGEVAIVWAAGRAGFGAAAEDMAAEDVAFTEILAFGQALQSEGAAVTLHLVSSAGGLFEGQTAVGPGAVPRPIRPYGAAKLAQEEALAASGLGGAIYRLSSVYGYRPGGRLGLISTLILNALAGRSTPITGQMETRRDYVLASDAGRFIAARIAKGQAGEGPLLLASGASASIAQVTEAVQTALGAVPLGLELADAPTNAADMSFDPAALPADWQPTPLAEGIAETLAAIRADKTRLAG